MPLRRDRGLLLALAALACIGGGATFAACVDASPDTSSDAGADADANADAGDALGEPSDAGLDVDQDPDAYPAKHQPAAIVDFLGGPVLVHPKIVTVTFAGDPMRDAVRAFDVALTTSDYWREVMTEYGVRDGTSGGAFELPDTVTGTDVRDEDMQVMLAQKVTSGALPAPDAETVYVVYFPPKVSILYKQGVALSCVEFVGYHATFALATDAGNVEAVYAPVARCDTGSPAGDAKLLTIAASHAIAEAATDPHPLSAPAYKLSTNDAWLVAGGSVNNDEVGDLCGIFREWDAGGFAVQRLWSNAAALASREPCRPSSADAGVGIRPYFGASPRTKLEAIGPRKSYGYVMMTAGSSKDVIVDVFSEAPLAHDLSLYTGKARAGDPTRMDLIPFGVTATLSKNAAHNGNGVVMTIAVPAAAPAGDYAFVVRALYDTSTFTDWPIIARVK